MKVYISATSHGLKEERRVVEELAAGLGLHSWQFENMAASFPERSVYQLCYEELQRADIFVGIYAHHYGWIPLKDHYGLNTTDGERSFIHMEYDWAIERKIPMLLFWVADKDADGSVIEIPEDGRETDSDRIEKMNLFKEEVYKNRFVYEYYSLDNLRKLAGGKLIKTVQRLVSGQHSDNIVFISHSTKDDSFVTQLAEKLHCCGLSPWVDHQHILPGADWDTAIEAALHAATYLIVVLTPEANRSLVVKAEWSYFGESGKKIFPIILRNTSVPFRLHVLQYTDFRHDPQKGFRRLLEALGVSDCTESWT